MFAKKPGHSEGHSHFHWVVKKKGGAIKAFNALFVCNRYICKTVIDVTMEKERKDSETGESW